MFVSEIFDECAEILGTTDQTKVFRKITQAVQTLMESGHWTHTTAEVDVCTGWDKCSLALPRGIDIPLAVNIDGSPTYFRNRLFQYHVNKGGMYNSVEWAWDDRGYVATLMDITRPSQLVAVAESNNDVGKTIRVLGTDQNNRNLRSQMPNGAGVDGLLIPIHSQQDFQYGTIAPDGNTIATRDVAIDPITDFTTTTPHGLSSGQGMAARLISGTIPVPLNNGQTYYVGVIDAYTVQLFGDSLNAQALQYPIALQSIDGFGSMQLEDKRTAQVETSLKFATAPAFTIDSPNEVVFPTLSPAQSLPAPLEAQKTYFANPVDSTHLQIFPTLTDATNNTNPVYLTGATGAISVDVRKAITPETKLVFSVKHYFNDGDQVQAVTNGGTLPQPLVANQNYFVNIIDNFSVSLHSNQSDALASTPTNFVDPIKITTSGSGTNSLVKLIQATSTIGKTNQITAQGLNITSPSGVGAVFQAVVVGSITSTRVTFQGSGYTSDPLITFSSPPAAPSGSTIIPRNATGYAVRDTINNKLLNIVITDGGLGYITAPAITIDPPSQQKLSVTSITKVVQNKTITAGNLTGSGTTATCILTGHGYSNNQVVTISGITNDAAYNGIFTITTTGLNSFTYTTLSSIVSGIATGATMVSSASTGTIATVITNENHGYTSGDKVIIDGASQSGFNGTFVISGASTNTFTYTVSSLLESPASGASITSQKLSGSQAVATAQITTSFLSHFTQVSGGSGYIEPPQVTITGTGTGATANAVINSTTLSINTLTSTLTTATAVISSGHGYVDNQTIEIKNATPNGYNGVKTITVPRVYQNIASLTGSGNTATCNLTGHGYIDNQVVRISGAAQSYYNGDFIINYINPNQFEYTTLTTIAISPATGTIQASISNATTFTYSISPASGLAPATGAISYAGNVTGLNVITTGTGYTSSPTVTITPSTGVFIDFSSTGALPSPLVSGIAYRAESPDTINRIFTIKNSDYSDVNITSSGTGTLYVVLSRAFGVDWTNNWLGDFTSLATGQQIYFGSDYILPTTTPSIDNSVTPRYLRYISNTLSQVYDTLAHATNPPSTTGLINIDSFGTGQTYYAIRKQVTPSVDTNLIKPASLAFLTEGETVQFSTSGTLPSPLTASTDYTIKIVGDSIQVYSGTSKVLFVNSGIGQLSLDITRNVTVQPSNNIVAKSSLYETGTELVVRAKLGDVLPTGLIEETNYYVRRIDNNSFELYDTLNHARDLTSTTGRKTYTTPGNKVTSTFFTDAIFEAVLVKSVAHIEKPLTDGYVSLYAWDYGRSNDMTLIGQYHPTEVNPQYRKIRIGKPCAWARILYQVTAPKVSSIYDFIPLEQERAIIAAVHAVDLEDKDFADQAVRYWGIAYQYLRNQQESIDGHAMTPPQINNITYCDGTDVVMW